MDPVTAALEVGLVQAVGLGNDGNIGDSVDPTGPLTALERLEALETPRAVTMRNPRDPSVGPQSDSRRGVPHVYDNQFQIRRRAIRGKDRRNRPNA